MVKKQLYVGADPFPPYQYLQPDGSPAGSDYEHVRALFSRMGYNIQMVIKEWNEIQAMVDRRELDAAFQVQPTPERLRRYAFSKLFRNAETQVITSKQDILLDSYAEIPAKGLKIGLIEGYVNSDDIDILPAANKKCYDSTLSLLWGISRGEVDIGVFDKGVKEYLIEHAGIANTYPIANLTFIRPLHVIFHDEGLRDAFNAALDQEK